LSDPGGLHSGLRALPDEPLGIRLWLIELDARRDVAEGHLSRREREQASRFMFGKDRYRYLHAHMALREILVECGAVAVGQDYVQSPHGKPRSPSPGGRAFNLSHSGSWALVGVATSGEIGVDLEEVRDVGDIDALVRQHFTVTERAEYACVPAGSASVRSFLIGWTRKEACLKALGCGLNESTSDLETGIHPSPRHLSRPLGRQGLALQVESIEPGPGLVAAVARVVGADGSVSSS
jgi:4'-phosphopantetheinyl transferase